MGTSSILIFYLATAGVLFLSLQRHRWFRSFLGYTDIRDATPQDSRDQPFIEIISRTGEDEPEKVGDMLVFESTLMIKTVVPVLMALVTALLIKDGFSSTLDFAAALAFVFGAIWWMYYLWVFRIVLRKDEFHCLDWRLRHRAHDLAQLESVEEDAAGSYRLAFTSGDVAYVTRYVTGHAVLKDILLVTLRNNQG